MPWHDENDVDDDDDDDVVVVVGGGGGGGGVHLMITFKVIWKNDNDDNSEKS